MAYPTTNLFLDSIVKDYVGFTADRECTEMENAVVRENV